MGIDLCPGENKRCLFDCRYCQLGPFPAVRKRRRIFVPTEEIIKEIKQLPQVHIDYITFSGTGESTLARNLGKTIKAIKKIRKEPIAVLTGSSLLYRKDVRDELKLADLVECKLDADSQSLFEKINAPAKGIKFESILKGIRQFRKEYRGKFALQIMFMRENEKAAGSLAKIARTIGPDEVHINTPTRPGLASALSQQRILKIKRYFKGMDVISLYDVKRKKVKPISKKDTLVRRGKI